MCGTVNTIFTAIIAPLQNQTDKWLYMDKIANLKWTGQGVNVCNKSHDCGQGFKEST